MIRGNKEGKDDKRWKGRIKDGNKEKNREKMIKQKGKATENKKR